MPLVKPFESFGQGASYKPMNCAENHTRSGTGAR